MAAIKQGFNCMTIVRSLHTNDVNKLFTLSTAHFSTSSRRDEKKSYKLLVVGGGCGGLATGHMFCRKLGPGKVAIIEPNETHYYQPMWTLVGGGIKKFEQSQEPISKFLPKQCDWIKDKAVEFDPENNTVTTSKGDVIKYDFLVVSMGLQLNYNKIKGLPEAFDIDPQICSNYWPKTVRKTFPALQNVKEGNAIFTYPNSPVKCAGAPQKIMYLAEELFRKAGNRDKINVHYFTSLPAIFGIKKYADSLMNIVAERNLKLHTRHHLIEVKPETRECVFENLETKETFSMPYSFLHVTPPMSTPDVLRTSKLVNETGFVPVNKQTLQHTEYPNIFALGDNANSPNAKTAAAIAGQTTPLYKHLSAAMEGKTVDGYFYNGYASCPLVTAHNKVIMAEFDWNGTPLETMPFNQAKERRLMYFVKAHLLPPMYWQMLIRGYWHGPGVLRKLFRLGMS